MNLNELDLDPNNAGSWPVPIKIVAVLVVCAAVLGAGYHFDTQEQLKVLQKAQTTEKDLKKVFTEKQALAANLDAYKLQMAEMQESFGAMLRQLPNQTEVAELLVDVSQTGLASGLEFELFEPKPENSKGFYAELPIKLRMVGDYHKFGTFISGLATLPRIVTIHDISISRNGGRKGNKDKPLVMEATAKTYRYLDSDSQSQG